MMMMKEKSLSNPQKRNRAQRLLYKYHFWLFIVLTFFQKAPAADKPKKAAAASKKRVPKKVFVLRFISMTSCSRCWV
ncbi:hypothetical protein BDP27DRAFT_1313571 [Rhodocollybia butyracea]|uniref:Uncharacterized protein n=1 Tax=Rhodocollybia butyracea TaxID=206335 RepID=A0A9P5Q8C8_9AGAR|nr:hypothetical protein BDP27DRAFT_1313571 [Rhodocollybia butyracea]